MSSSFLKRPAKALRTFVRARDGSVATIFAVSLIPIIIAAGVGIDLARAMSNRSNLQDALDSTALALAHMPAGTTQTQMNTKAAAWVKANMNGQGLIGDPALTVTNSNGKITIAGTAQVSTTLTAIAGIDKMSINATSTVEWGLGHAEVVLVLDNTGSMAGNKLKNLVTASKQLVTTLLANNTPVDPNAVKIAIVPFSNTVNIGKTYQTASWMDPTATSYQGTSRDTMAKLSSGAYVNRFDLFDALGVDWGGCVETRPQWVNAADKSFDISDTPPSTGSPGSMIVPMFAPDEPDDDVANFQNDYMDDWYVDKGGKADWTDRQANPAKYLSKNRKVTFSSRGKASYGAFYTPYVQRTGETSEGYDSGPNYGCGITPLQRLTNSSSTLTGVINKMVAVGNTNVPIGLFWGWMALSPTLPFGDGVAYGTAQTSKIVIVLTDGANTSSQGSNTSYKDSWYSGVGYAWQNLISTSGGSFNDQATAMNDREKKICDNMKAKNIIIYAVPVEVTDKNAKTFLQGCATTDDPKYPSNKHYIDVTDSANLGTAFTALAGSIGNLRISK